MLDLQRAHDFIQLAVDDFELIHGGRRTRPRPAFETVPGSVVVFEPV
jgi:hypothetical protein